MVCRGRPRQSTSAGQEHSDGSMPSVASCIIRTSRRRRIRTRLRVERSSLGRDAIH